VADSQPGEVTRALQELNAGRADAREELFRLVYGELRRLAGAQMAGQPRDHTLQPTALVHEAYLKLLGGEAAFADRTHFLNAAARAMRSILVDHARTRGRQKRGGGTPQVPLRESIHGALDPHEEVLSVHEALAKLETIDPRRARVVELRYFGGLTFEETARLMEIPERSVYRLWDLARAWLYREIGP
jgi:RNA polymerase sigma factor (TIGR02999 family)